jgi:hypothetical protein
MAVNLPIGELHEGLGCVFESRGHVPILDENAPAVD